METVETDEGGGEILRRPLCVERVNLDFVRMRVRGAILHDRVSGA